MALVITLVLEAATYAGSVALVSEGRVLAERSVAMRGREHEALMPAVAEVLAEASIPLGQVDRVVCGAGPGSFTSLRIAGGIAKGLALAGGVPLVPVSSLALLVASRTELRAGRYLGAIDALRGEHYVSLVEVNDTGEIRADATFSLVPTPELSEFAARVGAELVVAGGSPGAGAAPHARAAARLTKLIDATPAADLAAWEPAYGRLAEAQVKWEAAHGRPLASA
ncbi:MAG TPA: tRNA (adenosine(37)-N6)-threonylcarbamoyltransferase complex dimerization subunit type 1 TsaB [Gemmatimonadaceae bacterium]